MSAAEIWHLLLGFRMLKKVNFETWSVASFFSFSNLELSVKNLKIFPKSSSTIEASFWDIYNIWIQWSVAVIDLKPIVKKLLSCDYIHLHIKTAVSNKILQSNLKCKWNEFHFNLEHSEIVTQVGRFQLNFTRFISWKKNWLKHFDFLINKWHELTKFKQMFII